MSPLSCWARPPMTESDFATSAGGLALLRAGRQSIVGLRTLLLRAWGDGTTLANIDDVLALAGVSRAEVNKSAADALETIETGRRLNIHALPISSPAYPATLRSINDAPPILYVRGNLSVLASLPGVAVVGTRKATAHGVLIAERIAQHLSTEGLPVVSGLAMGIDAAAHEGALKGGCPTIAVLAHGLEKASPAMNRPLADRILDAGGLWVSEHALGTPAKPEYFVLRNRIQVGLSAASVIVEGEEKSGSRTQAEFCIQNRRVLFAVLPEPGSQVSTLSDLPRMLVSQRGASPIYSRADYPAMIEAVRKRAAVLQPNG